MALKTISLKAGEVFIFKLPDGAKLYLETLPQAIRLKKMWFGVPTKTLWEFRFPFYIRTAIGAWDLAEEAMELVVQSIESCHALYQLEDRLKTQTDAVLRDFVVKNEVRAHAEGVEKLGSFAAEKYLGQDSMLLAFMALPSEVTDIIGDYGGLLDELGNEKGVALLYPISRLPHPKSEITDALNTALGMTTNSELRTHLETVLDRLQDFVPDDEIPEEPEEQFKFWLSRMDLEKRHPKTKELFAAALTVMFVSKYGDQAAAKVDEFLATLKKQD